MQKEEILDQFKERAILIMKNTEISVGDFTMCFVICFTSFTNDSIQICLYSSAWLNLYPNCNMKLGRIPADKSGAAHFAHTAQALGAYPPPNILQTTGY